VVVVHHYESPRNTFVEAATKVPRVPRPSEEKLTVDHCRRLSGQLPTQNHTAVARRRRSAKTRQKAAYKTPCLRPCSKTWRRGFSDAGLKPGGQPRPSKPHAQRLCLANAAEEGRKTRGKEEWACERLCPTSIFHSDDGTVTHHTGA